MTATLLIFNTYKFWHHHSSFIPWILSIWPQIFYFKFFSHIRPTTQRSVINYRSFKTIDIDNLKSDILLLFTQIQLLILLIYLNSSPQPSIPYSTSMPHSNQKLLSLDPIHHGLIIPKFLWLNERRSRLERSWCRWKSPFDRKKFRAQCNFVRSLISKAKSNILTNLVTESSSNPRTLWKTSNSILHRNPSNSIEFIPWHTRHTITCQFIPPYFSDN